ncbi:HEAT repeat domain-containing protein [Paenibacillus methanolicus]|nr:HEAT repeat domain-containing protein [Paenibacillus methanolicus]
MKRTGKEAVPALIRVLKNDGDLRTMAAVVLGELGADAAEAIPALAELLGDDKHETQMAAALTLMRIGPLSLPHLKERIECSEGLSRFWASWSAAMLAPEQASPAMIEALQRERISTDNVIRVAAADEALGTIIAAGLIQEQY